MSQLKEQEDRREEQDDGTERTSDTKKKPTPPSTAAGGGAHVATCQFTGDSQVCGSSDAQAAPGRITHMSSPTPTERT